MKYQSVIFESVKGVLRATEHLFPNADMLSKHNQEKIIQ